MKILVDADACPVKNIIAAVAEEMQMPVLFYCDTSHILTVPYGTCITVDKASDSVDFAMANAAKPKDVAVTQDYALAAMLMAKGATVLHQNGFEYTNENIDRLLFQRHMGKEQRRRGNRPKGKIKARKSEDDIRFEQCLRSVLARSQDSHL